MNTEHNAFKQKYTGTKLGLASLTLISSIFFCSMSFASSSLVNSHKSLLKISDAQSQEIQSHHVNHKKYKKKNKRKHYGDDDSSSDSSSEAQNFPRGGKVVIGDEQVPTTLNVFKSDGDTFLNILIGRLFYAGVQNIDGTTLELIPGVVTELPSIDNGLLSLDDKGTQDPSDDELTVRYEIHPDAVWADGVPISGADIQFTLDTILDPVNSINTTTYEDIISTNYGPKYFEYTLPPTLQTEFLFNVILPKHDVEGSDFLNDWNDKAWVSGGPFVIKKYIPGNKMVLKKNKKYWKRHPDTNQKLPLLNKIKIKFGVDTLTALLDGDIDIGQPAPLLEVADAIEARADLTPDFRQGPIWEHMNFQFRPASDESCTAEFAQLPFAVLEGAVAGGFLPESVLTEFPNGYFANVGNRNENSLNMHQKFRQAVAHLIDEQQIVDVILGGKVAPSGSFVEAFTPSLSLGAWNQYDFVPGTINDVGSSAHTAHTLLTELQSEIGSLSGKELIFTTTSNNDARVVLDGLLDDMLSPVLNEFEINYVSQLENSNLYFGPTLDCAWWDVGEWAWVGSPGLSGLVSSMDLFTSSGFPPGGSNFYRWGFIPDDASNEFLGLYNEVTQSIEPDELIPNLQRMEQILADEVVIIPLYQRLILLGYYTARVAGVINNPTQASYTWNADVWYVPEDDSSSDDSSS